MPINKILRRFAFNYIIQFKNTILIFFIVFLSNINAMTIYDSNGQSAEISGEISIYGTSSKPFTLDYLNLKDNDSFLKFKLSNDLTKSLKVSGVYELSVKTQSLRDDTKHLGTKYGYIELDHAEEGKIRFGKLPSRINYYVFDFADKMEIGYLDAGLGAFSLDEGSNDGIINVRSAISYDLVLTGKVKMAIQVQGKDKEYKSYTINGNVINLDRKFGAGISFLYDGENAKAGIGYQRTQVEKNPNVKHSDSNVDIIGLGSSYMTQDYYIGFSAGYYKNLYFIGTQSGGVALYTQYKLDERLFPFIGLQYINTFYYVGKRTRSVDNFQLNVGINYNLMDKLIFTINHTEDLRSKAKRKHSVFASKKESRTDLVVTYKF